MIRKSKRNKLCAYLLLSIAIIGLLFGISWPYKIKFGESVFVNYKDWFTEKPKAGVPPYDMNSCSVMLAAKIVTAGYSIVEPFAALTGARHFFVNYFVNQSYYGIIEGGFIQLSFYFTGVSTVRVKPYGWDHSGLQWKVPTPHCEKFIACLHKNAIRYHRLSLPYNFLFGPNSNSFVSWAFSQCSMDITPIFMKYPFVGVDYFRNHKFPTDLKSS